MTTIAERAHFEGPIPRAIREADRRKAEDYRLSQMTDAERMMVRRLDRMEATRRERARARKRADQAYIRALRTVRRDLLRS